ncbi:MAG: DUF1538 domain-containing protein [Firmicutes bacterium]|nr:DUF1538 domain-containing protein [Bacillota bacterium]
MNDLKTVLADVSKTILPVIGAITVLQLLAGLPKETLARFLLGAIMVIIGLTLFTLGINLGLLPMGEAVGSALATRGSVAILIGVAFILGLSVTIAEPNTQILAHYVDFASAGAVGKWILIAAVAVGVAIMIALALLRVLLGIPISTILAVGCALVILLACLTPLNFAAISFDAGGVITGPLLVPFVLALGIGTASVLGGKSILTDGFGLIGLVFLGPIIGVLLLGVLFG